MQLKMIAQAMSGLKMIAPLNSLHKHLSKVKNILISEYLSRVITIGVRTLAKTSNLLPPRPTMVKS